MYSPAPPPQHADPYFNEAAYYTDEDKWAYFLAD